jgi:hypothetical protein
VLPQARLERSQVSDVAAAVQDEEAACRFEVAGTEAHATRAAHH